MDFAAIAILMIVFGYLLLYIRMRKYNEGFFVAGQVSEANGDQTVIIAKKN
jgi:hypothetical protein